jgi:hypothetical protein
MITFRNLTAVLSLVTVLQPLLRAADTEAGPHSVPLLRTLRVEPARIELRGANRQQQLLVTGETSSGRLVDVTDLAEFTIADNAVADSNGSQIAGVKDGVTRLTVRVADQVQEVPVVVSGFENYPPVHFANDVVPLLSKLGCNSGGCHGKAAGQNGFKLSVFGFDPAADYNALVKEARGRRVFPASPERSLVLLKASGEMPHGGGRRIELGSRDHELLLEWLKQGMPVGQADAPRLVGLKVSPEARIVEFAGRQQILATAEYSDGSLRDVTAAALYVSNAPLVAEASPTGQVTVGRVPGEAAITVNYMGQVAAVRILVPRPSSTQPYPALVAHNRIDELVGAKLRDMGIVPSEPADDATFLRRVYLDTLGTLPTTKEARDFLVDTSATKRQALVESVLAREEYADYWALDADISDRGVGDRGAFELHRWLKQQLAANRPYDAWVRELLTASGNSGQHGPVNFYRALKTPEELTRAVSQAFDRLDALIPSSVRAAGRRTILHLAGFFNGLARR